MVSPVVMNGVSTRPQRNLRIKELVLLNCGVGEDAWEFHGLQGAQTSQS